MISRRPVLGAQPEKTFTGREVMYIDYLRELSRIFLIRPLRIFRQPVAQLEEFTSITVAIPCC
jgi:hypothetical protein